MTSTLSTSERSNALSKGMQTNGYLSSDSAVLDDKNESTTDTEIGDEPDVQETEELTEEMKLKYANWPYRDIKEPHANDVLYGRGGKFGEF